jgi:hypothetical protein
LQAYHFCKHNDVRRQDPLRVVKTLAYQLANHRSLPSLRECELRGMYCKQNDAGKCFQAGGLNLLYPCCAGMHGADFMALTPSHAGMDKLDDLEVAVKVLLRQPLQSTGCCVTLLLDALDEGDGVGRLPGLDNAILRLLRQHLLPLPNVRLIVTSRYAL